MPAEGLGDSSLANVRPTWSSHGGKIMRIVWVWAAALLAMSWPARADQQLTIYTYESFVADWGPGPKIKANFEKECSCTVNFVAIQDGVAILNRLKIEGTKTTADVVLGLDNNLVAEAKALELFAPHGLDAAKHSAPGWRDDVFMPYDYGHFAFVYDSTMVKAVPKSLAQLVEGGASEKIIIEDPRTSTPGLGLLLWMKSVFGDKAAEAWTKLRPRILTVTPGWSEAYGLFTKGEAPMVLSYTTSPAYHLIEEKTDRYKAAEFSEGHYAQIEVAGIVKTSANLKLAKQFMQFMMGPNFQDVIPTANWMWPAGEITKPLPAEFDGLVKPERSLMFDPETVARNRKAWTEEWLNATSQ
jgi:thiamine transport system substrate-binding protein